MTWTFIEPSMHKDGTSEERAIQTRSVEVKKEKLYGREQFCCRFLLTLSCRV